MMALRRTPLLPPGWGLGRPSCSGIGASSVVRAAVSSAGMLLAGGRRSVLAQTGFCQLRHFSEVFGVLRRRSRRRTGGCCRRHRPQLFLPFPFLCEHVRTRACASGCVVWFGLCLRRGTVAGFLVRKGISWLRMRKASSWLDEARGASLWGWATGRDGTGRRRRWPRKTFTRHQHRSPSALPSRRTAPPSSPPISSPTSPPEGAP
jgi:hypothetical protein